MFLILFSLLPDITSPTLTSEYVIKESHVASYSIPPLHSVSLIFAYACNTLRVSQAGSTRLECQGRGIGVAKPLFASSSQIVSIRRHPQAFRARAKARPLQGRTSRVHDNAYQIMLQRATLQQVAHGPQMTQDVMGRDACLMQGQPVQVR